MGGTESSKGLTSLARYCKCVLITQSVHDGHAGVERLLTLLVVLVALFIGGGGAACVALQRCCWTETRDKARLVTE